jgi:cell division protein FtsQ
MRDVKNRKLTQKTANTRNAGNVRKAQRRNWKKISLRILRLLLVVCCTALVGVGVLLVMKSIVASDRFAVAEITVNGNQRLTSKEVIELSDIRLGVSTFDLNLEMIGNKLAENDWISSAQIARKLPQGIEIEISERKELFIINLDYLYYVDSSGEIFKVLRAGDNLDFPLVTGLDRQQLLEQPQLAVKHLRNIAVLLEELQQRQYFNLSWVAQINIDAQGGYTLYTDPYGVPIRVGSDNFRQKIDRLEHIFADIKKRLPVLAYIDLSVPDEVIIKTVSVLSKKQIE